MHAPADLLPLGALAPTAPSKSAPRERVFNGDLGQPGTLTGSESVVKRYVTPSVDRKFIRRFLSGQDVYTMHRPTRHRFTRRKTYSKGINDLFQADICDMTNVSSHNDFCRYLLTCIDVFSKYSWAISLRTKSGREVSELYRQKPESLSKIFTADGMCLSSFIFWQLFSEFEPSQPAKPAQKQNLT